MRVWVKIVVGVRVGDSISASHWEWDIMCDRVKVTWLNKNNHTHVWSGHCRQRQFVTIVLSLYSTVFKWYRVRYLCVDEWKYQYHMHKGNPNASKPILGWYGASERQDYEDRKGGHWSINGLLSFFLIIQGASTRQRFDVTTSSSGHSNQYTILGWYWAREGVNPSSSQ